MWLADVRRRRLGKAGEAWKAIKRVGYKASGGGGGGWWCGVRLPHPQGRQGAWPDRRVEGSSSLPPSLPPSRTLHCQPAQPARAAHLHYMDG